MVGGSEKLQPASPEEVPAGELERLATVRLVPGGRVAPVPDLGSVYAQDPDRLRGASGHVIRIVSPSSTQTVAGSTRTLVPAGRVGTVRLVAHRALRGSRSPVFVHRTPRAKTTRRRRISVLRTSRRIMIKTSSQVVTAFLGEPHPHSARVGDAFSRGWGDILRSYEAPSSSSQGTIRSLRGPDLLESEWRSHFAGRERTRGHYQ